MPAKLVDQFGNPLATKKPTTRHYRPIDTRISTPIRDLPPLTLWTIEAMLREPMIQLCLPMREAPLLKMEIAYLEGKNWVSGVRCDDPAIGNFAFKQILRIWNYIFCLTDASQKYGWSAAEVMLELDNDTGLLEVHCLVGRHPRDVRLMLKDGCPSGVQFLRTNIRGGKPVELEFPRAVFHAHFPQAGEWYGTSILNGAYSPWWDKWMRGGAADIRRLFMHKDAYGGADMTYPQGEVEMPDGSIIKNKDIAREVVEQMQTGAVTTRPYEIDEHGNNKWQLTRATVPGNPQHILQYPKDLDDEIRRGMGIPDDVVTSDSTGSWDGKSHSVFSFLGTLDKWGASLLRDIKEQIIDPLIKINFGDGHYCEVSHKPFVEQLKSQQGSDNGGQGGNGFGGAIPGDRPLPGGIGQDGGDDPSTLGDAGDDPSDRALRIAMSAIGRGVIEAQEVVRLASQSADG